MRRTARHSLGMDRERSSPNRRDRHTSSGDRRISSRRRENLDNVKEEPRSPRATRRNSPSPPRRHISPSSKRIRPLLSPNHRDRNRTPDRYIPKDPSEMPIDFCPRYLRSGGCEDLLCSKAHIKRLDAKEYQLNKALTLEMARSISAVSGGTQLDGVRYCLDFERGICNYPRCKFWHIVPNEERRRRNREIEEVKAADRKQREGARRAEERNRSDEVRRLEEIKKLEERRLVEEQQRLIEIEQQRMEEEQNLLNEEHDRILLEKAQIRQFRDQQQQDLLGMDLFSNAQLDSTSAHIQHHQSYEDFSTHGSSPLLEGVLQKRDKPPPLLAPFLPTIADDEKTESPSPPFRPHQTPSVNERMGILDDLAELLRRSKNMVSLDDVQKTIRQLLPNLVGHDPSYVAELESKNRSLTSEIAEVRKENEVLQQRLADRERELAQERKNYVDLFKMLQTQIHNEAKPVENPPTKLEIYQEIEPQPRAQTMEERAGWERTVGQQVEQEPERQQHHYVGSRPQAGILETPSQLNLDLSAPPPINYQYQQHAQQPQSKPQTYPAVDVSSGYSYISSAPAHRTGQSQQILLNPPPPPPPPLLSLPVGPPTQPASSRTEYDSTKYQPPQSQNYQYHNQK